MKKVILMAVLALALPIAAFADSATFINDGGTLSVGPSTISLTNSNLVTITGLGGSGAIFGTDLGTLSFTTGAFTGNFNSSGTFAPGGTFTLTGSGQNGAPTGVIFSGEFIAGPDGSLPTWNASTINYDHSQQYLLTGVISGTLADGTQVGGFTWQFGFTSHAGTFNNNARPEHDGITVLDVPKVSAPEPGMVGMLGMGLFGLVGIFRRKIKV